MLFDIPVRQGKRPACWDLWRVPRGGLGWGDSSQDKREIVHQNELIPWYLHQTSSLCIVFPSASQQGSYREGSPCSQGAGLVFAPDGFAFLQIGAACFSYSWEGRAAFTGPEQASLLAKELLKELLKENVQPLYERRFGMSWCCGHHHHYHHCSEPYPGGWFEESPPPYSRRYAPPPREEYTRRLEEERDLLERRLRRLEHELEELRQTDRPASEQG